MKNPLEVQAQTIGKTKWHLFHNWSGVIMLLALVVSGVGMIFAALTTPFFVFWAALIVSSYVVSGKVLDLNNTFAVPPREAWGSLRYFKRSDGHLTELAPGTYDLRIVRVLTVPNELDLVAHEFDFDPECPLARCDLVSWKLKFNFTDADHVDLEWFVAIFEIANTSGLYYYDTLMVDPFLETFEGTPMLEICEREDSEDFTVQA